MSIRDIELVITLWAACLLYLYPLKHRSPYLLRIGAATVVGGAFVTACYGLQELLQMDVSSYMVLVLTFCVCIVAIYFCGDMKLSAAVYCATWAIITQQIVDEIAFIITHSFSEVLFWQSQLMILIIYVVFFLLAGFTIVRYMPVEGTFHVGPRQLTSAIILLLIFEILYSFLRSENHPVEFSTYTLNIMLIQCYCVTILYLQDTLFKKSAMQQELNTLNQIWHQQKQQYELSKENITLINRKCHDLKHQIAAMRTITSAEEQEKYLREIENSVQIYDSMVKTGNEILDTVLTEKSLFCKANSISINCIADGRQMDILDPIDLYTIFGNAIDNAIESVKKIGNQEMRMIDVVIYAKEQLLMINILNPIGSNLKFDGDLPVSTKAHNGYHGFGLKSIRHTVKKYDGFMKIDTAGNIFSLKILIPLPQKQ